MNSLATILQSAISDFAELVATKYNLPRDDILSLWNSGVDAEIRVAAAKAKPVRAVKAKTEASSESLVTCEYEFKKGKNAGTKCTAKVCESSVYCRKHKEDAPATGVTAPKKATTKTSKKEKPAEAREASVAVVKSLVASKTETSISKNSFGNYEHKATHLVFDKPTKRIVGRQQGDTVVSLSAEDIENCKRLNFKYTLPTTISSAADDVNEEDEEVVEKDDESETDEESEEED